MTSFFPPVDDIKNKLKNLRTTFQHQYKMVKTSKVHGSNVLVPQWKHYQELMFLKVCKDLDCSVDVSSKLPVTNQQEENKPVVASTGLFISISPHSTTSSPSFYIPSKMLVKCYWTEKRECALIDFYSGKHDFSIEVMSCHKPVVDWSCWVLLHRAQLPQTRSLKTTTTVRLQETLRSQLSDHSVSFSGRYNVVLTSTRIIQIH